MTAPNPNARLLSVARRDYITPAEAGRREHERVKALLSREERASPLSLPHPSSPACLSDAAAVLACPRCGAHLVGPTVRCALCGTGVVPEVESCLACDSPDADPDRGSAG